MKLLLRILMLMVVLVRDGVHNFSSNLGEPKVLVNDVLEGNLRRAANTTGRFGVNSTVGVVGLLLTTIRPKTRGCLQPMGMHIHDRAKSACRVDRHFGHSGHTVR
jgi:hypothetical protein